MSKYESFILVDYHDLRLWRDALSLPTKKLVSFERYEHQSSFEASENWKCLYDPRRFTTMHLGSKLLFVDSIATVLEEKSSFVPLHRERSTVRSTHSEPWVGH